MGEEFQESDIIFHDQFDFQQFNTNHIQTGHNRFSNKNDKSMKKTSSPVNIPNNVLEMADLEDSSEDYGYRDLVPPHVVVRRRVAGKMAFSVCTGNGRTLKGRDLSQVRNSILRMTGFLES